MKFCLDARTATEYFPGIGRYVSNLARTLAAGLRADEQLIVLSGPSASGQWALSLPPAGRAALFECAVSPFGLRQQLSVPSLLRAQAVDVYHSPYYLMPYRPGKPTVVTIYDLIPQLFPQYVSARARLLFRFAMGLALQAADHVLTISEASRQDLLAAYRLDPARVTALPLAPEPVFCPQPGVEIARVRKKFGLPERFVLYLGINKPHKNLVRLVEAWAQVETDAQLVIAGAWDARYPQAMARAAALGLGERVRFLGPVLPADQPGLYAAATVFVFPSLYEGFGLPVIEAMACGTPVACSRAPGLQEAAGEAARMFDPARGMDIARVLSTLLSDEGARAALAEAGLQQAGKFAWEQTARATLEVYRKMGHE